MSNQHKQSVRLGHKRSPKGLGREQSVSNISANTIFLACNFGNNKVKRHFDMLKQTWEETLPVRVYLSDQVKGEGARDLWQEITLTIKEANLAIFDVTSFRPNVILELGYALANKQPKHIIICRDLTPDGRRSMQQTSWLMSDISHLYRTEYKSFDKLDKQLLQHVERMSPVKSFYKLVSDIERHDIEGARAQVNAALGVLIEIRDNGPISRQEFKRQLENSGVNAKRLGNRLIHFNLAKPTKGRNGVWQLID